jgi:hypothetical protein
VALQYQAGELAFPYDFNKAGGFQLFHVMG